MALDVDAQQAGDELEGDALGRLVAEPVDEGGREELAQPVGVLVAAGEDLARWSSALALELDALARAEGVLGRVEEAKADPALAVELADVSAPTRGCRRSRR